MKFSTKKWMLKLRFQPILNQKKWINGMWENQLAKLRFYYIERKTGNAIRLAVFCNIEENGNEYANF